MLDLEGFVEAFSTDQLKAIGWRPQPLNELLWSARESSNGLGFISLVEEELQGCLVYKKLEAHLTEILFVGTHPKFRGQGVAKRLLRETICSQSSSEFWLESSISQKSSTSLYRSLGFQHVGCRKRYYQGKTDALLWTRTVFGASNSSPSRSPRD